MNEVSPRLDNLSIEREAVLTALYTDIVQRAIASYSGLSVIKTMVFAFIIRKKLTVRFEAYSGRNDKDLVLKCLSQMVGLYNDFLENIPFIVQAMHLLLINNRIELSAGDLIASNKLLPAVPAPFGSFINKAIAESENYTDRQFLREVISCV